MADPANSLLQLINPDYKPLRESSKTNMTPVTSQPFNTESTEGTKPAYPLNSKTKPGNFKSPVAVHRAGDWVCLFCNNHNYSFREICNRCNVQTKVENLRQSLAFYQNQNARPNLSSPPFLFDQPFPSEQSAPKNFSVGSLQTLDLEQSATRSGPTQKEGSFTLALPRGEREPERKEFAFEKQLCFSSSEDEAAEEGDEELMDSASKEQEKRILKFLNFD